MLTMFQPVVGIFCLTVFALVIEPDTGPAPNALCAYEGKARPVSTNGNAHEISLVEGFLQARGGRD
jgi:hypothetical protein